MCAQHVSEDPYRLSDYIRNYGSVSRPTNEFDECDSDLTFYRLERRRLLQQMQRNILPLWSEVRDNVLEAIKTRDEYNAKETNNLLRQMLEIGREMIGLGSSMDLVESSAVYVLQVFHDSKYLKDILGVTSQQITELRQMFGEHEINNQLINKAYDYSKAILELLDTEERERMFIPFSHNSLNSSRSSQNFLKIMELYDSEEEWANNQYKDIDIDPFVDRLSQKICVKWDSILDDFKVDDKLNSDLFELSFEYKDINNSKSQKSSHLSNSGDKQSFGSNEYDIEWINSELINYINKYNDKHSEQFYMNIEVLVDTVIHWINSSKSDEELGVDLHSLLGDSCLSLIEKIVKNRGLIKESYNQIYCDQTLDKNDSNNDITFGTIAKKKLQQNRVKGPAIVPSVVVQTVEEKNLKKQIRKMEKKMNKEFNKDSVNSETNNGITYGDIERMKEQREAQLLSAMYGPLFKEEQTTEMLNRSDYPYVFDSYIEAKSTPAFISGAKMSLPLGFIRNDQRRWEELTIPAPPPPPDDVVSEFRLIDVEELDEFGKIAFKGIKKLNRIQSIVFKTAYTTNQNMLICAPTGAGKTNVAMLAILNEIRSNSPTGSVHDIDLDKFKIVYIAPMKALAAEMTDNFSKKLLPFGIRVRELTGDMQLSKTEIMTTQILVTTPEKWDVVTRKAKGDVQLLQLVKLIIIDEVHLLQSDRGPVVEALVARTKRYIESAQKCIRMIGLSATLPNYRDVGEFLHVNPKYGLFVFDNRFRPVPLSQCFIGCKATQTMQQMHDMDEVCYEKVHEMVSKGHQVMVFVHARNATHRTAVTLKDRANKLQHSSVFKCETDKLVDSERMMRRARHKGLSELFESGFAIHHAGMLRQDRNLVEKLFRTGVVKVLVCTATLAWGVNLPAHSVVIKGTEMYDSSHGTFVDISMLDVMQIFGRAGRPQYDTEGHGTIITAHNKLRHYLSLLTNQYPIESNFKKYLTDNMNAEIVSGTITTIDEAVDWIRDTYLFIRMRKNPICYGISQQENRNDTELFEIRRRLVVESAEDLDKAKMIRYSPEVGTLDPTDLGRTASHYYIKYDTIMTFNELIDEAMDEKHIFSMIATAQEFDQLKSREDEFEELEMLLHSDCRLGVPGGVENKNGKVNILMQSALSRAKIDSFSLVSDSMFVMQNVNRIARGLFEYVVKRGWAILAQNLLKLSKMFERRMWEYECPLRQFDEISYEVMTKLERAKLTIDKIRDMTADDIGHLIRYQKYGSEIKRLTDCLPNVEIEAVLKPITRTVLMVQMDIKPRFRWDDRYHGKVCESFWIWMFDIDSNHIYHSELLKLTKKQVINKESQKLVFNIPLLDPDSLPSQYIIHCSFDRWLGCDLDVSVSCRDLILPEKYVPYTKLLDLTPLPVSALNNPLYESLYNGFTHFNPIQTQVFHTLYQTDSNVLLGAPTGSGKTIAAEIAMFRVFNTRPNAKIVYIAPLKALVRERVDDWKIKIQQNLGRRIVELTGDVTPDVGTIMEADVIVTTPEKWDGVSRSWQTRKYVREVALIVIDEIHLLGEDRGPVLEVIVSRTNFIREKTCNRIRIIGLSTAIANAQDLANWLDIKKVGLYNFKPSVRPVPIEVHVQGYPGKNYCPRMALMNKPAFRSILQHSPEKPVLVFVSSRRQTRLTAFDFMSFLAADHNPYRFLHMNREEMSALIQNVRESSLQSILHFGIGIHHAGLHERDRSLVEELFANQKIQVLITTATLAWGVNLPAHAVVIKGTEYFDAKKSRYVDFPITDVLQMMGRAGRPQFDTTGVAVVLVHDIKKEFYKKFLYEPFPVESNLLTVLSDHLNAEIVSNTITTKQEAIEYLNWTYLFRRVLKNPNYYGLKSTDPNDVNKFLSQVIDSTLETLFNDWCLTFDEDERTLTSTPLGRIASYYYLNHSTVRHFWSTLSEIDCDFASLLDVLTNCYEYNELPVRHNEDILNGELAKICPIKLSRHPLDSPHTKANLLLQAHISRLSMPNTDYFTDLKSVLDQSIRIMQAMIDVSALAGALPVTLRVITLMQMIVQCRWHNESPLLILPEIDEDIICCIPERYSSLPLLIRMALNKNYDYFKDCLKSYIKNEFILQKTFETLRKLPLIECWFSLMTTPSDNNSNSRKKDVINIPLESNFDKTKVEYISVESNTDYTLICRLNRFRSVGRRDQRSGNRSFAPKFPKPKDENWFLVLGNIDKSELIAIKRIGSFDAKTQQNITFTTPSTSGTVIYSIYFCSDSYLNLDQQFNVYLNVN